MRCLSSALHLFRPVPYGRLAAAILLQLLLTACGGDGSGPATVAEVKATATPAGTVMDAERALRRREEALASARVWTAPVVAIGQADLRRNPSDPGGFRDDEEVTCRFTMEPVGGTTPKFNCQLPNGEVMKIKYGTANPELRAEVAATRLLNALGFGADRVYVVGRVRCAGCPVFPFQSLKCYQRVGLKSACFAGGINYNRVVNFDTAVIERRIPGRKIEGPSAGSGQGAAIQGWAWYELDKIDPGRGGSPRAEVDALRLMAVVLAHWDNKAENQRLVCPPDAEGPDDSCTRPLAIMQDLGATFGPNKVDLHHWRNYRVWADAKTCRVSMKNLPWQGATFPDRQISEEGRQLLLAWLEQLSESQLKDLFEGSRITAYDQVTAESRNPAAWVAVFTDKIRQIREAGPCPSSS